jgi:YidC/Oxa1 family membrane protein insertase
MEVFIQNDADENTLSFARNIGNFSAKGYIGPKDYKTLKAIEPSLVDTIEYGWFTFIAKPAFLLLDWLYSFIGNWGFAIVALTIIIRIVLFPLTYKGMVSMNKLKELAPRMKEIQTKYKGDPQKINAHVMELYRKHGANPMGGCLPILIQIPIFFAIYRVLLNAIELKGAEWILWINDLAELDPYFILPILMGITMYIQQHITPTNFTDPMQEKIMKFLPLIFTFFFITFPAGLTLYWFINNLCSIAQQMVVNKIFERHKAKEIAEKRHEH